MNKRLSILAAMGLLPALAAGSWAYVSVDVDVRVQVENRISGLKAEQQVGAERVECDAQGARVVRVVKTEVEARAEAEAKARASADARYSDSCSNGGVSCHTSGSGSDSDSDSASDSASASKTAETKFTVALASFEALARRGFTARPGEGNSCSILDENGKALEVLDAIAALTWVYGEELVKGDGAAAVRSASAVKIERPKILELDLEASGDSLFDGGRP